MEHAIRVKRIGALVLSLATLISGIGTIQATAQASQTYRRTKAVKTKKVAYYTTSKAGSVYKFSGSLKKTKMKSSHALKNYTNSTWIRLKKVTITTRGKRHNYYYVKSSKNQATGWLSGQYLKAGRDHQMTSPIKKIAKNYVRAKAGTLYQLKGTHGYVKFTKPVKLTTKKTYRGTKQRTVYLKGKKSTYFYVTSGRTKGWVSSRALKAGTYKAPVKPVTPQKPAVTDQATLIQEMKTIIQNYAVKNGYDITFEDGWQQVANQRAIQLYTNRSDTYDIGDGEAQYYGLDMAEKLGIYNEQNYAGPTFYLESGLEEKGTVTAKDLEPAALEYANDFVKDLSTSGHKGAKIYMGLGMYRGPKQDSLEIANCYLVYWP